MVIYKSTFKVHFYSVLCCLSVDLGDLRFSQELCEEEVEFLAKRKQFVFEAMKELLGDKGPTNISEVRTTDRYALEIPS